MPDLIYHVDNGLSVALLERINHTRRLPVREDCLDERDKLIPGNCGVDQPLPWLFTGVDGGGWIREIVRTLCGVEEKWGLRYRGFNFIRTLTCCPTSMLAFNASVGAERDSWLRGLSSIIKFLKAVTTQDGVAATGGG